MSLFEPINQNLQKVKSRITNAAEKSGRNPDEILLVVVGKTHPPEQIKAAIEFGATDIGESRLQEAAPKIEKLGQIARWHMIGHIQTNKAKKIIELFDLIQSVDSLRLAEEISRRADEIGKKIECLIEINSSGEQSKFGVEPKEALELIKTVKKLSNIRLSGLMTIGPWTDDEQLIRTAMRKTKKLFDMGQNVLGESFNILSMGMSDDFEIAIEEGSTMVRVGTAVFGARE